MSIKKILNKEYYECQYLGFHHSLAEGDFYDRYSVFPDAFRSKVKNNECLEFDESIYHEFEYDLQCIVESISLGKVIEKKLSWVDVSTQYLEYFAGGFVFLSDYSKNFYIAAWINKYIDNPALQGGLFTDYVFSHLDRRILEGSDEGLKLHTIYKLSKLMNESLGYSFLFDEAYDVLSKRYDTQSL